MTERQHAAGGRPAAESFVPVPVGELELSDPGSAPPPNALGQISILVRIHGIPLGTLSLLQPGPVRTSADVLTRAMSRFEDEVRVHLAADGQQGSDLLAAASETKWACTAQPAASTEFVSVIICTLGEDARLRRTIDTVLAQTHSDLEVVVVDNNPGSGALAPLVAGISDPRLRVVPEVRRGLSVARNAGLAAARAPLVAYTDDDAFADPQWLRNLIRPFGHPQVACVTGLVLPAELVTAAQLWFEEFGAFDKGFDPLVWNIGAIDGGLAELGAQGKGGILFPYSAGVYGSGNNMAFRADWLRSHGGFDVALGAGTLARGGEDLDIFLSVVKAGGTIVYEPRAVVRHYARGDMAGLRTQMYGYGSGMAAVIAKHFVAGPRAALDILARVPAGFRRLLDPGSEKNESKSAEYPRELRSAELFGYLAGPLLYVRSRRDARRRNLSAPSGVGR